MHLSLSSLSIPQKGGEKTWSRQQGEESLEYEKHQRVEKREKA